MMLEHLFCAHGDGAGMRTSAKVLIYIDVQKALDAGIKFYLSENGVVLSEGDERGFISPDFFERVERGDGKKLAGWEGGQWALRQEARMHLAAEDSASSDVKETTLAAIDATASTNTTTPLVDDMTDR
jgi:2'-phosphotransferase